MQQPGSTNILLVEDDDIDASMVMRASADVAFPMQRVKDGAEALAHLRNDCMQGKRPSTELVLLDLNIPGTDGHEVLTQMKADPDMRRIPVVILSSSDLDRDITRAYDSCAAAFLKKPVGRDGYAQLVKAIKDFWIDLVVHP